MDHPTPLRRPDDWIDTEATIISCKETLGSSLRGAIVSSDGYDQPPDYIVVFRYVAAQQAFTGKYEAHSEQAIGNTLTISYDPLKPSKNTGTDLLYRPWIRISAWAIGASLAALAVYLGVAECLTAILTKDRVGPRKRVLVNHVVLRQPLQLWFFPEEVVVR